MRERVCASQVGAVVTGATRRGLLIGFELPGSSRSVAGARARHPMGDDSSGMQEREQSQLCGQEIPSKLPQRC